MAKKIELNLGLEKPVIVLNGKEYEVNDEKSNVLKMNAAMENAQASGKTNVDVIDNVLEMLVGKKATKEINETGYAFSQYMEIFFALLALVQDEDLEVVKARFHKAQ